MRHSTTRYGAPLALTTTLLTTLALTAGCAGGGQTVSTDKPRKQTRFHQRADRIEQTWPRTERAEGHHESMLPAESARPAGGAVGTDAGRTSRTVSVTVGHSACDKDHGAHVAERGKLVVVAGWAKPAGGKKTGMCTGQLVTDDVKVQLKKPLGDRPLVDAVTGSELPRQG